MLGEIKLKEIDTIREHILQAKESRWKKQLEFVKQYQTPIISFKFNVPSWPKNSTKITIAFDYSLEEFIDFFKKTSTKTKLILLETNTTALGPEAFFQIKEDPTKVKALAIQFESEHFIGRLLDIDVLDTNGSPIERSIKRQCYLCDNVAIHCMREEKHTVNELRLYFDEKLKKYIENI